MSDDLDGEPCAVGGEAPGWEVVEPDAILEVADGVLDLGVTAVVGLHVEWCVAMRPGLRRKLAPEE